MQKALARIAGFQAQSFDPDERHVDFFGDAEAMLEIAGKIAGVEREALQVLEQDVDLWARRWRRGAVIVVWRGLLR